MKLSHRVFAGGLLAIGLVLFSTEASADYVTKIFTCYNNTILTLASGTQVYFTTSDNSISQNSYDHLYAQALELLASGRQVDWYDAPPFVAETSQSLCGQSAYEIHVFRATNNP